MKYIYRVLPVDVDFVFKIDADMLCNEIGKEATIEEVQVFETVAEYRKSRRVKDLAEALRWTAGSTDFGPGGVAEEGWRRIVQPLLDEIETELKTLKESMPDKDRTEQRIAALEAAWRSEKRVERIRSDVESNEFVIYRDTDALCFVIGDEVANDIKKFYPRFQVIREKPLFGMKGLTTLEEFEKAIFKDQSC